IDSPGKWGTVRYTEVIVLPGNEYSERITCPSTVLQEANVTVRLKWPEGETLEPGVRLECLLYPTGDSRATEIAGARWDKPILPQVTLPIGADGEFSIPQHAVPNPYNFNPSEAMAPTPSPGPYAGAVASWPNLLSPHEAKCAVAAVHYSRSWKVFGPEQRNGPPGAFDPYGMATVKQVFAMVEEPNQGDVPVLEAHPGKDNVWTIEVSKEFVERVKSEAKRLATPSPYTSQ
ncbi:MAG TPA: hypothetical protein VF306_06255, partial [Pirellulales bacterium]